MSFGSKIASPNTSLYDNLKAELKDWKLPGWNPRHPDFTVAKQPIPFGDGAVTSGCSTDLLAPRIERWSASKSISPRKWKTSKGSADIFDKLMVRAEKGSRMGRQLSLDSPQRPILRRQISEELKAPRPLKIAWTADHNEQPSVQVVAKKCGQPKPSTVKPPRSPFMPDHSSAVVYSRQQLTERLRTSWKKSSGRHNLNIFLNQSVESETDSVSEVVDSPETRSPSSSEDDEGVEETALNPTPEPPSRDCDKGGTSFASDRRQAFRMMGRQSKIMDSPCSTPEPSKAAPQMRRMMSAPTHQSSKKLSKAPSVESRIKSAPPKRKHKPQPAQRRRTKGDSSDDEKGTTRRVKRGVEKGEIVTMVSLVSPAESEEDEPLPPPVTPKLPPTPKPAQEPPRPNPPPPPVLSLRKPVKAVSFRPVVPPQPSSTQYQTSFPLKRTLTHQNTTGSIGVANPNSMGHPPLQRQLTQILATSSTASGACQPAPRPSTAPCSSSQLNSNVGGEPDILESSVNCQESLSAARTEGGSRVVHQKLIQRKPSMSVHQPPSTVRRKVIQATHTVIKLEPEPVKVIESSAVPAPEARLEEDCPNPENDSSAKPIFKNSKEKECWELFKKMSDRGVTVSFETVLRGLLTPTEYRMRRSALLSVC